jgi:hypothetical protein
VSIVALPDISRENAGVVANSSVVPTGVRKQPACEDVFVELRVKKRTDGGERFFRNSRM